MVVADVVSGKHDPLGILDPQTSINALKQKYPNTKNWSDQELLKLVNGKADDYPYLGERLAEDPTSPISSQHRPFTSKEISEMPKFMQDTARMSGMGLAKTPDGRYVARVMGGGTDITIDRPEWFDRATMAHELTHAYQNTRTREFQAPEADYEHDDKTYDYGGMPGLLDARAQRKTIANFSVEQQAEMVKHYYDAHRDMVNLASQGKLSKSTAADFEEMKKAYGPFIRQLAGVPTEEDLYKPITAPPPPGVPGYEATGYISGDPNIMDFAIRVK